MSIRAVGTSTVHRVPTQTASSGPLLLLALLLSSSFGSKIALTSEQTQQTHRYGAHHAAVPDLRIVALLVDKIAQTTEEGEVDCDGTRGKKNVESDAVGMRRRLRT